MEVTRINFLMYKVVDISNYVVPIQSTPVAIENYEHYTISYWGGILFNTKTKNIVKGWLNEQGYRRAKLRNDVDFTQQYIQRLVAGAWLYNDDPVNKTDVNHKDHNRDNNNALNLEYLTHADNMAYIVRACDKEILDQQINEAPF